MKPLILIFSLLVLLGCENKFDAKNLTIGLADAAYNQLDINKNKLMAADSIGFYKANTLKTLARIERESGNFTRSMSAAEKAELFSTSETQKTNSKIEYAQTVYDFSMHNINNKLPLDTILLSKTSHVLLSILEENAGSPEPSILLLGISLLQNDGKNVLNAWGSYFHISDINKPSAYLADAAKELNEICEKWSGNRLTVYEQEKLIIALSNSRFYEYANDFALYSNNEKEYNKPVIDFLTYARYLNLIKHSTNEYYREIAIGKENMRKYKHWLENQRKELWDNLSLTEGKKYTPSDFLELTKKHFGALGFTGSTGNYKGFVLALGHIVNQETTQVEQYGYKAELTYTQLDMMTSNGYSTWFWENRAIGGWATSSEIIRVRAAYLAEPFYVWNLVSDSLERNKIENQIAKFSDQPKSTDRYNQSDGLELRLGYDAINDLYTKLYNEGLRGIELKLAFLSTYENYRIEASIFAHEGRHSIDKKYFPEEFKKWSNDEREFHAKLSQLVFAKEPRLELAGMVNEIGESGHGLANKRIVDTAINWIENNTSGIEGYSDAKSAFSQIYLLKNKQIQECFKHADPLFLAKNN